MKFNRIIRSTLATAASAALGLGTVSCSRDYTPAYVYSVSASTGVVSAFAVDYQSGILTQISGSPFTGQSTNPVGVISAPNGRYIYVISGTHEAQIQPFAVGTDGKIYGQTPTTLGGNTYPTAAAIDSTNSYMYVAFTYAQPFTPASPGPGGIAVMKINSDGSLTLQSYNGQNYIPTGNNPVAIAVSQPVCAPVPVIASNTACSGAQGAGHVNVFVYVVDREGSTYSPGAQPTVMGFAQNTSTGALTLLNGTTFNTTLKTYQGTTAGVQPSAIAIDPTARYVYVTDRAANQIYGYSITNSSTGTPQSGNLTALATSPYATGLYPVAITIDPRGKYVYTANYNANTVSSYAIDNSTGALGGTAAGTFTTSTGPTCVTIDPALGIFIYTSNYLDSSLSGGQLSPNTGSVSAIPNTPFTASSLPSCVTSVANGSHASSIVNP